MKKLVIVAVILFLVSSFTFAQDEKGLRVFISVDMEGISGTVNWRDVNREGKDYERFRLIMTREASAAVAGAFDAGATYVVVRDGHASARNIIPEELDTRALLLRDWSGGYKAMMEGVDESFDAVVFIGYHAKAGTPDAIMDHTMSSKRIEDISINGVSLPEAGINALIAGAHGVPVVFVAGDKAIGQQVKELFGSIETVSTKAGIGEAELGKHPAVVRKEIRAGVKKALGNLERYKPYKLTGPYTLILKVRSNEFMPDEPPLPGVEVIGQRTQRYSSDKILDVLNVMRKLY